MCESFTDVCTKSIESKVDQHSGKDLACDREFGEEDVDHRCVIKPL